MAKKKIRKSNGKSNGKQAPTYMLSNEERLEFQNLDLQRKLLDQQVKEQVGMLDAKQNDLADRVNNRLGIDLMEYRINLQNGELTYVTEEERNQHQAQQMAAMGGMPPAPPPDSEQQKEA